MSSSSRCCCRRDCCCRRNCCCNNFSNCGCGGCSGFGGGCSGFGGGFGCGCGSWLFILLILFFGCW